MKDLNDVHLSCFWRHFSSVFKGKNMKFTLQEKIPEKNLVSLSLETRALYLGNAYCNWQHCRRRYVKNATEIMELFSVLLVARAGWRIQAGEICTSPANSHPNVNVCISTQNTFSRMTTDFSSLTNLG